MIAKCLGSTGLLLLFYNLWLIYMPPSVEVVQNQWQENIIKAQQYVFEDKTSSVVIVGSSIAARLNRADFPDKVYNLSFAGGSFLTGLSIIQVRQNTPKVILIETNVLTRKEDTQLQEGFSNKVLYNARKYLPALREKNQPIGYLGFIVNKYIVSHFNALSGRIFPTVNYYKVDPKVFKEVLAAHQNVYSQLPDSAIVNHNVANLKNYVAHSTAKGIRVIFFEMPIDPSLIESEKTKYERKMLHTVFPSSEYKWVPADTIHSYQTTDGIHLNDTSAHRYALYLQSYLEEHYSYAKAETLLLK